MANGKTIHLGRAFSEGWNAFKTNAGPAIAAYLIFLGIATVAGYILCIGTIASIFVLAFPFMGGLTLFYLNVVKGKTLRSMIYLPAFVTSASGWESGG